MTAKRPPMTPTGVIKTPKVLIISTQAQQTPGNEGTSEDPQQSDFYPAQIPWGNNLNRVLLKLIVA
jgi:hypothetical protein